MVSPVLIDKSGVNNTDYYPFALQVEFDSNVFEYKYHNDRYFYRDGLANAYIDPAAYARRAHGMPTGRAKTIFCR